VGKFFHDLKASVLFTAAHGHSHGRVPIYFLLPVNAPW